MPIRVPHLLAALLLACAAGATLAAAPRQQIEIYRIAPGEHAAFIRFVALCDEANRLAGLPPRQLYVHQDGAAWDFLLIQPADETPEQARALEAAWQRLKLPEGAKFFVAIRKFMLEHSDTVAIGPTTAAEWLKQLD